MKEQMSIAKMIKEEPYLYNYVNKKLAQNNQNKFNIQ